MSKNKPTIRQLRLLCRHIDELVEIGMTVNHAIRTLELIADTYAKFENDGKAKVWHVNDVPKNQWSLEAQRLRKLRPKKPPGTFLRVEHGTPRRQFAEQVRKLYATGKLTERSMQQLTRRLWKMAVITHEEDRRLNRNVFKKPQARWAAAKIRFPKESPNAPRVFAK